MKRWNPSGLRPRVAASTSVAVAVEPWPVAPGRIGQQKVGPHQVAVAVVLVAAKPLWNRISFVWSGETPVDGGDAGVVGVAFSPPAQRLHPWLNPAATR